MNLIVKIDYYYSSCMNLSLEFQFYYLYIFLQKTNSVDIICERILHASPYIMPVKGGKVIINVRFPKDYHAGYNTNYNNTQKIGAYFPIIS